jgi:phosphate-selective porin OprO/OprP
MMSVAFVVSTTSAQDNQQLKDKVQELEQRLDSLEAGDGGTDASDGPDEMRVYFSDGSGKLNWETADGRFSGEFGGRIMFDWTVGDIDDNVTAVTGDDADGAEFRRARLFTEGTLYDIGYKFQVDFAGAPVDVKSVYLDFPTPIPSSSLKVGKFKEDMMLVEKTSSKYISLMARPIMTEWAGGRDLGAQLGGNPADGRLHYGIGAFRADNITNGRESTSDGHHKVTGRLTGLPYANEDMTQLVHIGASGSVASLDPDNDLDGAEDWEPEVHLAPDFVDPFGTTDFADGSTRYALESAFVYDSFSAQAEWAQREYDMVGSSDPTFSSWYVQGSYFLTGEVRPYDGGEFDRISPKSNFTTEGGTGAWEIAARYSTMDLNDSGFTGGQTDIITAGVNWYLNPSVRVMLNYTNADVSDALGNPGVDGSGDFVSTRFQIDF